MTRVVKLVLAGLAGVVIWSQVQTLSVSIGGKSWAWNANPTVSDLKCNRTTLSVGDIDVCTVTIDIPAPQGFQLPPLTCSANIQCSPTVPVIPAGATSTTFQAKRIQ